jgi:hypothetical protein
MADNTASLVVALSAQLSKFEKDMKQAGIMADQATNDIEKKFSSMSPKISTSFFGNFFADLASQAVKGAVEGVKDLVERFKELQKVSEYTALSMQWVYGLQAAGAKAGAAFGDINTALKSIAFQVDEMQRGGDNALKTLLDANPQFMKGVSRDTLDAAQALRIVSNIISEAKNNIQAVDIAKNLGLPESTVALLQKGGDAVEKLANDAARAAPDLAKIAEQSKLLAEALDVMGQKAKEGAIAGLFIYLNYLASTYRTILEAILPLLDAINGKAGDLARSGIEALKGAEARIAAAQRGDATFADRWGALGQKGATATTGGGTATDPFARKTAAAETASAYERETNAINKQIATMQAENATLGESAHAQEEYRVQLILSEKAAQDEKEFTQALNDEIAVTAERAATAKQALAEHTFALQRLNSASQQVGSALSTAFADAIVEGKSLNDVMQSLIKTLEKAAINALVMNLFTPGAGGSLSPVLSSLGIGHAAGGADNWRGGPLLVGEKGPELVNLPRGSQVIPNDVARSMGSGGSIVYSPAIDARGASVEAVARLAAIMEADRASFASRTVTTIQLARRGRVPGL